MRYLDIFMGCLTAWMALHIPMAWYYSRKSYVSIYVEPGVYVTITLCCVYQLVRLS